MMAHYMSPLVLPPRSETLFAINPTPNTFFNQINEVLSNANDATAQSDGSAPAPGSYGVSAPSGSGFYSPFKTPAPLAVVETNPFDNSFGDTGSVGGVATAPVSAASSINNSGSSSPRNSAAAAPQGTTMANTPQLATAMQQAMHAVFAGSNGLAGDLTTDALDGIQQLMGAAAAEQQQQSMLSMHAAGRISGRSDSMSLLTAASELELANHQQLEYQQHLLRQVYADKIPRTFSPPNSDSMSSDGADSAFNANGTRQAPSSKAKPSAAKAAKPAPAASKQSKKSAAGKATTMASAAKATPVKRQSSEDDDDDDDDDDMGSGDNKREKFLERNRIAAQKCRRRRKERLDELQNTTADLQRSNESLIKEISFLKDENYYVRTLLMEHRDCAVLQDSGLGQLLDSVTRPSIPNAIASAQLAPIISRTSSYS